MKVFAVRGHSESGDHYVAVFKEKPSDEKLYETVHRWDGSPEEEGPGEFGSYVHIEILELELQ